MKTKEELRAYCRANYLRRKANGEYPAMLARNRESFRRNRDKVLARGREYYRKNKAHVLERSKRYHKLHPEIATKAQQKYRERHPDRLRATWAESRRKHCIKRSEAAKQRYSQNREAIRAKANLYRKTNIERWRNYDRAWRKRNAHRLPSLQKSKRLRNLESHRQKDLLYAAKRRALKRAATINLKSIKEFIANTRAKKRIPCYWCQVEIAGKSCHFDHVVALSIGGSHSVDNLCVSCESCNCSKGAKSVSDWVRDKDNPQLLLL